MEDFASCGFPLGDAEHVTREVVPRQHLPTLADLAATEEEGIGFVALLGIVSIEEKTPLREASRYRDTRNLIGSF